MVLTIAESIVVYQYDGSIIYQYKIALNVGAVEIFLFFCYTLVFVTLSRFHAPLGKMVETYLKIKPQKQKRLIQLFAWSFFVVTSILLATLCTVFNIRDFIRS